MAISQQLDLRQSQTLVMTPQLQQAIKLLQMSNQELNDFVATEIENNPLLERDDEDSDFEEESNLTAISSPSPSPDPTSQPSTESVSDENGSTPTTSNDERWDQDIPMDGEESFTPISSRGGTFDEDEFSVAENIAEKPSLREHLIEQIQVDIPDPGDRIIAATLVELLDDAGYLPADLDLIRSQLGASAEKFEQVIQQLQKLDPPGIFARSLQECLALQLREKDRLDPAMQTLLKHLDLVAKRDKTSLMKLCGVDAEDLSAMIEEIRQLDPKPAQVFTADVAPPIIPDVILRPLPGGTWHIELNNETLPRVLANNRYYARVQAGAHSKSDKEYLSDRWQQATWLVKALQQRATTILKVASEIVKQQDSFFVNGVQYLRPLILKDIATAVEMHESTVSRVTQNKFIATPRGMFELKYFFTTGLTRTDGGATVSSESVRERIKCLIDDEALDNILSDDRIAELLHEEGVDIARRTVAKYRESLKISSSSQRRREKKSL